MLARLKKIIMLRYILVFLLHKRYTPLLNDDLSFSKITEIWVTPSVCTRNRKTRENPGEFFQKPARGNPGFFLKNPGFWKNPKKLEKTRKKTDFFFWKKRLLGEKRLFFGEKKDFFFSL